MTGTNKVLINKRFRREENGGLTCSLLTHRTWVWAWRQPHLELRSGWNNTKRHLELCNHSLQGPDLHVTHHASDVGLEGAHGDFLGVRAPAIAPTRHVFVLRLGVALSRRGQTELRQSFLQAAGCVCKQTQTLQSCLKRKRAPLTADQPDDAQHQRWHRLRVHIQVNDDTVSGRLSLTAAHGRTSL